MFPNKNIEGFEILKPGVVPKTTIKFECENCTCVFNAKEGFYTFHSDQREGDFYDTNCPVCGERVTEDCKESDEQTV